MVAIKSAATYDATLADGALRLVPWAQSADITATASYLTVSHQPRQHRMAHSPASGDGLVSNGQLGVDVIRLAAGQGFVPHVHPGDHLLICVGGEGTITYDGSVYPTRAGQVYMIDGSVPHAVGAITDHVILAVGSPHMPVDAEERMRPVEYREVISEIGSLTCLICDLSSEYPAMLHDVGCVHCPCAECNPLEAD